MVTDAYANNIKINGSLDTNFLKLIAIIAMTSDHFGKIIFPQIVEFQIIGRIAFPIFAYCVVVGYLYTSSFKNYIFRLLIFGTTVQVVYMIIGYFDYGNVVDDVWLLNIFFTLVMGALAVVCIDKKKIIGLVVIIIASIFLNFDYGLYGILLMPLIYIFRKNIKLSIIIIGLYLLIPSGIQKFAVFALIPIYWKTNFNLNINKYFFYIYYPAHFVIIVIIKILMDIKL